MSAAPLGPILPIDSGRYGSEAMRRVFADDTRYAFFVAIEAAVVRAQARLGLVPEEAAIAISARAEGRPVTIARVRELERANQHEVMSVIQAFAEQCGAHGRFVHCGPTSSDVIDTAIALQLKDAIRLLDAKLRSLVVHLADLAEAHATTPMVGRTHGQHALPITFGFKVAGWADEAARHVERLAQLEPRVVVGKMAGAVGSMAGFGPQGPRLQREVMADLGVRPPAITTQIVSRDRVAEMVSWAALAAASLETISTEVRHLQRPEIGEVSEHFDEVAQIGSSTMPQKRNPVLAENVCGLARIVRSLVVPALETVALWDERDLTNSAVERFTIPEACILLDEMIDKTIRMVRGLRVFPDRMAANLEMSKSSVLAEAVMLELVRRGLDRRDAYGFARHASGVVRRSGAPFGEALLGIPEVARVLDREDLRALLDPARYLGECVALTESVVRTCRAMTTGDDVTTSVKR